MYAELMDRGWSGDEIGIYVSFSLLLGRHLHRRCRRNLNEM